MANLVPTAAYPLPLPRSARPGGYGDQQPTSAPALPSSLFEALFGSINRGKSLRAIDRRTDAIASGGADSVGATAPEANPYAAKPGLLAALLGNDNPISQWTADNRHLLQGFGSALLSDGMDFSRVPMYAAMDDDRRQKAAEWVHTEDGKRRQLQTLQGYGEDYADIADALSSGAIDENEAMRLVFSRRSDLSARAETDNRNRLNAQFLKTPELRAAVESDAMTFADAYKLEHGGGATDFGMTPIWGQFPDGKTGYGVQGSDGNFHPVDTGEFVPMDPRTLYSERAAGSAQGKGEGLNALNAPTAAVGLEQMDAKTDHVIDTIDKAIWQLAWDSTGLVGQGMGAFGGTKAYDLRKTAQTIKANLGFAELQAMRDSSPTGGALGSIAVQELEALQSTLESLDPNQSEDQLRRNLENIKTLLDRQKHFRRQAYDAKYGPYDGQHDVPNVSDQAEYDALPSGSRYVAPDGTTRTKP